MFTDHWCPRCGKSVASNLYKIDEERWQNDAWKIHWRKLVDVRQREHDTVCRSLEK
jgi:hypothetical protein